MRPKVFRDPVYDLVAIDGADRDVLLPLIDSPEFQRLRRIRQLGLSAYTFHGAEHSRFAHSLGTYHVAKRMLDGLSARRSEFDDLFAPLADKRLEILAAALLHDVGHGPFSHVLERTLVPSRPAKDYPRNHEGWTQRIIGDRIANRSSRSVDWQYVGSLYDKGQAAENAAADVISSQLDADRLDYLLRDARAAGVPYAAQIDLEWLLNSIRIGRVSVRGIEGKVPRLCFTTPKARGVIEQYVLARQCMYLQVYMHKTTRAYEALLRHIFGLAADIIATGGTLPDATPEAIVKAVRREPMSTDEYLSLDDCQVWVALSVWAAASDATSEALRLLAAKADALVNRRRPYRTIELQDDRGREAAIRVDTLVEKAGALDRFSFYRDDYQDTPYRNIFYARGKEEEEAQVRPIYLLDADGNTHLAEEDSEILRRVSDVTMRVARVHYDDTAPGVVQLLREHGLVKEV